LGITNKNLICKKGLSFYKIKNMKNYQPHYQPDYQNEIIATFTGESKLPLKELAMKVAEESSIGTWTKISTCSDKIFNKLSAKVFFCQPLKKIFKIAYPLDLFEPRSIPQLLSSIAGNIFSMKIVKNLRLDDIEFPAKYINQYPGPQ
jgi:ribulose-bisphosphate carboxylase large chain